MGEVSGAAPAVLAVDGGGSKTDVLAIGIDGALLAHARGEASNPQVAGWDVVRPVLDGLRREVLERIGPGRIRRTHVYLAGMDLPAEYAAARQELEHWAADGGAPDVIDNDLFALLRAGTLSPDAAVVVCGTGVNALAVRADGATARFSALGEISGDVGGGAWMGAQALFHAARALDGRGPATTLTEAVPAALGFATVAEVTEAFHFGRRHPSVLNALSPVLVAAAHEGDAVARDVLDRQAAEIVTMAVAALGRIGLLDRPVPVVLGGGVLAARPPLLVEAVLAGLAARAPLAEPVWVTARPVLGAGLAALEGAGASPAALDAFRAELAEESALEPLPVPDS